MNGLKAPSWLTLGTAVAMAGCSTVAPTTQSPSTPATGPAVQAPLRSTQAQAPLSFEQLSQVLPQRLTQAEGQKILVNLPADKLQGPLDQTDQVDQRSTQQFRGGRGFGGRGFGGRGFGRGFGFGSSFGFGGLGAFSYYPYGSLYYPYYLSSGYYYPYYSYATPYYTYPYYSYASPFYRPYSFYGYRRFW